MLNLEGLKMQADSSEGNTVSPASDAELYRTFDSFPWSKTVPFLVRRWCQDPTANGAANPLVQGALIDTLGGAHDLAPRDTHVGTSIFCRGVFYQRQTGIHIDITKYIAFVSSKPGYPSVDAALVSTVYETCTRLAEELKASNFATLRLAKAVAALPQIDPFEGYSGGASIGEQPAAPAWQHTAPLTELRIKRDIEVTPEAGNGTGDAPSSERFAAVAAAIQSGQPLEGVRQIPDTVEQPPVCLVWELSPWCDPLCSSH
jgi:hypothetical protein